jgi:CRP/FNR family cyclic AMP-dependent transcriptional regulator
MSVREVWDLRKIEWLAEVEDQDLAALERGAVQRRCSRGEMVFAPTPNPRSVYLLQSGLVRIYRLSEGGGETSLGYVAPGEVFGELPAFGDYPRESFAQAVQPSLVWKIPRENLQRILSTHSMLAVQVTRQIGDRLKRIETRVEDLVFRNVRTRVARMVAELARDFGRNEGGRWIIDIPITQGELATLVGATRQTVNQTLRELAGEGLIGRESRRIVVYQPELLRGAPEAAYSASAAK